jgi:hypothetical protein
LPFFVALCFFALVEDFDFKALRFLDFAAALFALDFLAIHALL